MSRRWGVLSAVMSGLAVVAGVMLVWAQEGPGGVEVSDPLPYVRIFSDAAGESHFETASLPFRLVDFAPPAPPISVTEAMPADGVAVISSPAGWHGVWHPAPHRQLMFVLAGEIKVQVSDGEVRRFGPGSVVLVEDTVGKGHVSTVVGAERCHMATVSLEQVPDGMSRPVS